MPACSWSGRSIAVRSGHACGTDGRRGRRQGRGAHGARVRRRCRTPLRRGVIIAPAFDAPSRRRLSAFAAAHPVPDDRSVRAGRAAVDVARACDADGRLLVLLSGGASALMAVPAPGVSLDAKREVTRRLLRADADIHAVNCVRKHLSARERRSAGGVRAPASTIALAVSDVVGDDPSVIGSGPTVADPTHVSGGARDPGRLRRSPRVPAMTHGRISSAARRARFRKRPNPATRRSRVPPCT